MGQRMRARMEEEDAALLPPDLESGAAAAVDNSQADIPRPPRSNVTKHQLFLRQLPEAIGRNQVKKALKIYQDRVYHHQAALT